MTLPADTKSFYWNWLEHAEDPDYERTIDEILRAAERRLGALMPPGSPARTLDLDLLLRLVDAELGRSDTYTERLRRDRWKRKIETVTEPLRAGEAILDCGSGFGTEAIAFAWAGATVTAVDVFPVYLRLVRKRAEMYGRLFGIEILSRINCVAAHLPEYQPSNQFDVIWSNESIEHIAPLDRFFARLGGWLRPDGRVVICNDNAMSPLRMIATIRARGSLRARHEVKSVPGVADKIEYGIEIIRSPGGTTSMLEAAGLGVVECSMMSVFPSQLVRNKTMYRVAQASEVLSRVPGLRVVAAGDYILVARPAGRRFSPGS